MQLTLMLTNQLSAYTAKQALRLMIGIEKDAAATISSASREASNTNCILSRATSAWRRASPASYSTSASITRLANVWANIRCAGVRG